MASFSNAGIKAGFPTFPWKPFFNVKETIDGHNRWYNNSKLLKSLGIAVSKNDYVGLMRINATADSFFLPERFVVISPGASNRRLTKAWEEEKVIDLIREESGKKFDPKVVDVFLSSVVSAQGKQ